MEIQVDNFPYVKIDTVTSPVGKSSPYHNIFFYSAPNSPAGETSIETSPFRYQDANSNIDDFEFDSSRSFSLDFSDQLSQDSFGLDRTPRQRGGSPPTMAFADELFRDGKVMPLASPKSPLLKLPPRLQRKRNNKLASAKGMNASPPSNIVLNKSPVGYKKLWNDDFDPFMAALENVMEVKKEKASTDEDSKTSAQEPMAKQMKAKIVPKRKLSVPKGFEFAREVRIIQIGQMGKLDKFLKKLSERDGKSESMTKKTPTLLRKLSFKSASKAETTNCKEEKRVSHPRARSRSHEMSKMVLMHYNPRGIPCMGYN